MLRIIQLLKWKSLKSQLQYPANFLFQVGGMSLMGFAGILRILILILTFETIGGWRFAQAGFMIGVWRLCHGLHLALFMSFWSHPWLVREGQLDRMLVRPVHPLLQILASDLPLMSVGDFVPGLVLLGLTYQEVAVSWSLPNILFLVIVVCSGSVIEWAVLLATNTLDFWFTDARGVRWIPYLAPLVAGSAAALAIAFWSIGLRHYQSTGT